MNLNQPRNFRRVICPQIWKKKKKKTLQEEPGALYVNVGLDLNFLNVSITQGIYAWDRKRRGQQREGF